MAKARSGLTIRKKKEAYVIRLTKADAATVRKVLKALSTPAEGRARPGPASVPKRATQFFEKVHFSMCESRLAESGKVIVIDIE